MIEFKAWDIVKLKNHTSHYRVYSIGDGFIFACLYADVIVLPDIDEVVEVVIEEPTAKQLTEEK